MSLYTCSKLDLRFCGLDCYLFLWWKILYENFVLIAFILLERGDWKNIDPVKRTITEKLI